MIHTAAMTVAIERTRVSLSGSKTRLEYTLKNSGATIITLLALNDDGAPSYDQKMAQQFANLDVPTFACTPDKFPDLMATALNGGDIAQWAAKEEVVMQRRM